MAKFIVTSGSHFDPFFYESLSKPVMQAVEAHNAAQDSYDTLMTETEALRQYIMREPEDSEARRLYDSYTAKLATLQNNLWERGYNAGTRRDLAAARAGYASDITRLGTAIKARQDISNEYWKTKHDHPDMIMASDPGLAGLDEYLRNDRFGKDYYSYSGDALMKEVATDAQARMNEMLNDPRILDKYPQLKGYIPILKKEGFTSAQVEAANLAVRAAYAGNTELLDRLDPASAVLASVMASHVDSTGAFGKVDSSEFNRLLDYAKAGLSQSIGKSDVQFLHDLEWAERQKQARENERYQHNLNVAALKAAGKGGSGAVSSSAYGPTIAQLRGNALNGIADKGQAKDFVDKTNVYEALSLINELKKSGALRNPNGTLSDSATNAMMRLYDSPYYKELTNGKDHYLSTADLDSVLKTLGEELNKAETNDHMYQFNVTAPAAANMAKTMFKPNIGQLSGKQGDKIAASVAHYSDGSAVKASELKALLESDNVLVGFDARTGNITLQRNSADDSQDTGKYNDKIVYLNTRTVLAGTTGYANAAALLYAFDSAVPDDVSTTKRQEFQARLESMVTTGQTVDLRDLASLIQSSYTSLMKSGDDRDKAVFNALVEAFAQGLFDSSNTAWSPNTYKEGWSAKTGGAYMPTGYDDEDYEIE